MDNRHTVERIKNAAAVIAASLLGQPKAEDIAEVENILLGLFKDHLIERASADQPDEFPFPKSLTPPLRRVLSMMMWETGPIAHALRATGEDIARKAEDEQAVVLHWLVGFVLEHGDDWHKHAAVALRAMTDSMTKPGEQQP